LIVVFYDYNKCHWLVLQVIQIRSIERLVYSKIETEHQHSLRMHTMCSWRP